MTEFILFINLVFGVGQYQTMTYAPKEPMTMEQCFEMGEYLKHIVIRENKGRVNAHYNCVGVKDVGKPKKRGIE
jgi:hypothetical protein